MCIEVCVGGGVMFVKHQTGILTFNYNAPAGPATFLSFFSFLKKMCPAKFCKPLSLISVVSFSCQDNK